MKAPISGCPAGVRSVATRLCSDKRGVAAIEFAIIGTLLLTATLGFAEIVMLVRAQTGCRPPSRTWRQ